MPIVLRYVLIGLWVLLVLWVARGTVTGRTVKGGMVRTRAPLRSWQPFLTIVVVAACIILSLALMPYI